MRYNLCPGIFLKLYILSIYPENFMLVSQSEIFWHNMTRSDCTINLALHQPTNESSVYPASTSYVAGPANLSVDGNFDPNYNHGSCSSTNDGGGGPNWFTVDLGQTYTLSHVAVTSSTGWGLLISFYREFKIVNSVN